MATRLGPNLPLGPNLSQIAQAYGFTFDNSVPQEKYFQAVFDECLKERWEPLEKCQEAVGQLTDHVGRSLLMRAVEGQHEKVFMGLAKRQVGVLLVDGDGDTALHMAARLPNLEFTKALCLLIPLNIENRKGETPATLIEKGGNKAEILKMLHEFANGSFGYSVFEIALNMYQQILILDPEAASFSVLQNMGSCYAALEQFQEAVDLYEQALKLAPEMLDFKKIIQCQLASCYIPLARYQDCINIFDNIWFWMSIKFGPRSSTVGIAYGNLGLCYKELKQYDRAIVNFEEARLIFEEIHGKDHLVIATALNSKALCYMGDKQYQKAIETFEAAVVIITKNEPNSPHIKKSQELIEFCRGKLEK